MRWRLFIVWLKFVGEVVKHLSEFLHQLQPAYDEAKKRAADIKAQYDDDTSNIPVAEVVNDEPKKEEGGKY